MLFKCLILFGAITLIILFLVSLFKTPWGEWKKGKEGKK